MTDLPEEAPTSPETPTALRGGQQVPDALTYVSPADLYVKLGEAWDRMLSDTRTRASVLVLVAHWALETGFGHAMHCWNLGNVQWSEGCGYDYCAFLAGEVIAGKNVPMVEKFRAYRTIDDATKDYLVRLRAEFRPAWPAVLAGDPALFCHLLKVARYYTASEDQYTAGVVRCYRQLDASIAEPIAISPVLPDMDPDA